MTKAPFRKTFILFWALVGIVSNLPLPRRLFAADVKNPVDPDSAYCTGDTGSILPQCTRCGNCNLDDFVVLFVNIADLMLAMLSVVALIFMVWSGYGLVMSGGNPEKIESGKNGIKNTLMGAAIVLLAWIIINLVVVLLTGTDASDGIGRIFQDRFWYDAGATN